jgi:DNA (cytosine-5)-methyltransferase 1
MSYTLYVEFAGAGGSFQGAAAVPGVELMLAANPNPSTSSPNSASAPSTTCSLAWASPRTQ